jgi:hypothetical protein
MARRLFADDGGAPGVGAFDRAADGGREEAGEWECCRQGMPAAVGCGVGGGGGVDAGVGGGAEGHLSYLTQRRFGGTFKEHLLG